MPLRGCYSCQQFLAADADDEDEPEVEYGGTVLYELGAESVDYASQQVLGIDTDDVDGPVVEYDGMVFLKHDAYRVDYSGQQFLIADADKDVRARDADSSEYSEHQLLRPPPACDDINRAMAIRPPPQRETNACLVFAHEAVLAHA